MRFEYYPKDSDILASLYSPFEDMVKGFLETCWDNKLPVHLIQGLRTLEEETSLHAKGASHAEPKHSYHLYGLAVDWCFDSSDKPGIQDPFVEPAPGDWEVVAKIAEGCGLASGYNFKTFQDKDHIQMKINCLLDDLYPLLLSGGNKAVYNYLDEKGNNHA